MLLKANDICPGIQKLSQLRTDLFSIQYLMLILQWKVFQLSIKFIPKYLGDFKYLLVGTCEINNFIFAMPINAEAV